MAYNHGVRVKEQATSLVAPVTGTAGLQVIIGTAPVNLAADPYKATNVPMIAYSFSEAVEQAGYSDDFKNYTLCQSMDACFRVLNVAPIILINVLDPKKHKKANEEQTVNVEKMQATVKVVGILADTVEVKANEATLTAGTDYITTFDDDGYLVITLTAGGKGASAKTLTVNSTSIDPKRKLNGGRRSRTRSNRASFPVMGENDDHPKRHSRREPERWRRQRTVGTGG